MRYLLPIVLISGCVGASGPQPRDIEPLVAAAGVYALMAAPSPPPPPVAGDVCPGCYGRGIVGDGTTMVKCQRCNGTGKITTACKDAKCPPQKSTPR